VLYWLILIGGSIVLAYAALFIGVPFVNRSARSFGDRVKSVLDAEKIAPVAVAKVSVPAAAMPIPSVEMSPEMHRSYSSYEGFKSFARSGALSIEDIVKGLSREHMSYIAQSTVSAPIDELIEEQPIERSVQEETQKNVETASTVTDAHGFASALVGGDRDAVFAGLRQHVRSGGAPEHLVSSVACLLDDTYRARMDGTVCDATLERLSARLDTPTLEKLVGALTTAIDSSYSDSVTGAKLAFTRALSILGA
jgi:hypothetical protein